MHSKWKMPLPSSCVAGPAYYVHCVDKSTGVIRRLCAFIACVRGIIEDNNSSGLSQIHSSAVNILCLKRVEIGYKPSTSSDIDGK